MGTAGRSIQSIGVSPSTLSAGGRRLRDLPARGRRAAPLHAADPARERAPARRGGGRRGAPALAAEGRAIGGDLVPAGTRAAAGLHRRACGRRPGGDAERDGRPRRRPGADQPAASRRARDRPLGAGRRVRDGARDVPQRRARVRAQPRALRVPALGTDGVRQLQGRPAEHRHRPPGQPRVPRARDRDARRPCVSRHARRHGFAHDDGQRARRARLGRRRHRGRGGDARRGGVDADPAGRRVQAHGRAAGGRDRDRPRPDGHAAAAERPVSSGSSSSTSGTGSSGCRSPTARRSGTCRPSTARPAASSPWTTRRSSTCG